MILFTHLVAFYQVSIESPVLIHHVLFNKGLKDATSQKPILCSQDWQKEELLDS